MATPTAQKQIKMHTDFFDRTALAIENGFYLEAMFREYAAIEGRLEVLLGVLGAPCNKHLPSKQRKDIKISHRITCLSEYYNNATEIGNTKLSDEYFTKLSKWANDRNTYVHGLYKNEVEYDNRCTQCKHMAEDGLLLTRMLYNEVKRIRKYIYNHPEIALSTQNICITRNCMSKK